MKKKRPAKWSVKSAVPAKELRRAPVGVFDGDEIVKAEAPVDADAFAYVFRIFEAGLKGETNSSAVDRALMMARKEIRSVANEGTLNAFTLRLVASVSVTSNESFKDFIDNDSKFGRASGCLVRALARALFFVANDGGGLYFRFDSDDLMSKAICFRDERTETK